MPAPSHRDRYPDQYSHDIVGKYAEREHVEGATTYHKVLRVMPTRFGLLAELEGVRSDNGGMVAFSVDTISLCEHRDSGRGVCVDCGSFIQNGVT